MAASGVSTVQERGTALPILITRVAICIFAVSQTMLSPLITQIGAAFSLVVRFVMPRRVSEKRTQG